MKEDKKKLILEKLREIEELLNEGHERPAQTQETTPTQPPPTHPGRP